MYLIKKRIKCNKVNEYVDYIVKIKFELSKKTLYIKIENDVLS